LQLGFSPVFNSFPLLIEKWGSKWESLKSWWSFAAYWRLKNRNNKVETKCEISYDPLAARIFGSSVKEHTCTKQTTMVNQHFWSFLTLRKVQHN
jgi:hypothetical protein